MFRATIAGWPRKRLLEAGAKVGRDGSLPIPRNRVCYETNTGNLAKLDAIEETMERHEISTEKIDWPSLVRQLVRTLLHARPHPRELPTCPSFPRRREPSHHAHSTGFPPARERLLRGRAAWGHPTMFADRLGTRPNHGWPSSLPSNLVAERRKPSCDSGKPHSRKFLESVPNLGAEVLEKQNSDKRMNGSPFRSSLT